MCASVRVSVYVCAACLYLLSYVIAGYINSIPSSNEKKERQPEPINKGRIPSRTEIYDIRVEKKYI